MANKTEILLRARQHARATRTTETLRKIGVPEWDTDLYFWPDMSVEEKRGVFAHMRFDADGSTVLAGDRMLDAAVAQVLLRARDEMGNRLFSDADEAALRDTAPDVLSRISNEMGFGRRTSPEDAEKN